jgi:hypothetical protein
MNKTTIEAAIKRAEACGPSNERDNVLAGLKAMHRSLRVAAKEPLTKEETGLPQCPAAYTRAVDIETDLRDIEIRDAASKATK